MPATTYYGSDLAWIHHVGFSQHVARVWPGILRLLHEGGLAAGARVLDVGCGSGLLARRLLSAGFSVTGIDASPAMIELAREYAPGAEFDVLRLPTGLSPGSRGALPDADAVVSTGHVLNYLDSRDAIVCALRELARVVRTGGVLALDLMSEEYREQRQSDGAQVRVTDDWAIMTRFSCPAPHRFDRAITVFRRTGEHWRRSDEYHRNLTFDAPDALRILRESGIDAEQRLAFGDERLPEGLVVLAGARRP
jgi:SAM-dependent methyltransferase